MDNSAIIPHMFKSLLVAGILVMVTANVHFIGLSVFSIWLRAREWMHGKLISLWKRYLTILIIVLGLFGLHSFEIWLYSFVYYFILNAFSDFEQSLYFSTITFVSLGSGDVVMPRAWRIVGAIEAVNGVILLGWSSAFFITVVGRLRILEHEWIEKYLPHKVEKN